MVIPYQTAKYKSANIFTTVIYGPTGKFNSRQYLQLYGICFFLLAGCKRSAHNIMEQCPPQKLPRNQAESQHSSITPEQSTSLFYRNQFSSTFHCGSSVAAPASLPPSTTNQWGHRSPQPHPSLALSRSHSQG